MASYAQLQAVSCQWHQSDPVVDLILIVTV